MIVGNGGFLRPGKVFHVEHPSICFGTIRKAFRGNELGGLDGPFYSLQQSSISLHTVRLCDKMTLTFSKCPLYRRALGAVFQTVVLIPVLFLFLFLFLLLIYCSMLLYSVSSSIFYLFSSRLMS